MSKVNIISTVLFIGLNFIPLNTFGEEERVSQGPCREEIKTHCPTVISGQGRIENCLRSHKDDLTNKACKSLIDALEKKKNSNTP